MNSRRYDIFWWYDIHKLRAPIGNWGKLALERKLPRYHVNIPHNLIPRTTPLGFRRAPGNEVDDPERMMDVKGITNTKINT